MERFVLAVWNWFCEFGWGFAMLILSGLLIAAMVEIMVKKTYTWLADKWAGHDRLLALLNGVKMVMTQIVTCVFSVWFAQLVAKAVALPGGEVLLPIWCCCIYFSQYIFSMIGWKGVKAYFEERKQRKSEPKPKKEKPVLTPTETEGIFKNEFGELVNKNGKKIKV